MVPWSADYRFDAETFPDFETFRATLPDYYRFHNKVPPERIPAMLGEIGAGDSFSWFSYPGGHGLPLAARGLSQSWYDRWFGYNPITRT